MEQMSGLDTYTSKDQIGSSEDPKEYLKDCKRYKDPVHICRQPSSIQSGEGHKIKKGE